MPKKPPKNAYFFYMLHFKEQEERRGKYYRIEEVSVAASDSWKNMNAQQRGPFEKKAKEHKLGPHKEPVKYTSQGIPLSIIDRQKDQLEVAQKTMTRTIKEVVNNAITDNTIGSQEFYFISGQYFVKANEDYVPAELALVKFTFENGVVNKLHTYVNPETLPKGYLFDAKDHSEKKHRLPIPPNAKGQKNYNLILDEIDKFMGNTKPLPPLFTLKKDIPMIQAFMREFCAASGDDPDRYRVFPLHQLFYDIKEEAVKNSIDGQSFASISHAETHLDRDHYTFMRNTACNFHEELDCVEHCALANVQKWAYIFADHICVDLNIPLIAGRQLPQGVDVSHLDQTKNFSSQFNDTDTTSNYTGFAERKPSSSVAVSNAAAPQWVRRPKTPETSTKDEDFPSLGSHNRRGGASKKRSDQRDTNNPWNTSSSSSGSYDYSNDRRESQFQNDSDMDGSQKRSLGRGSRSDVSMDSSVPRSMGRGSILYRNQSMGRGGLYNDRSLDRNRSSGSSHHYRSKRYHPWGKSEYKDNRHTNRNH